MTYYRFSNWHFEERVARHICNQTGVHAKYLYIDAVQDHVRFLYVFARQFSRATYKDVELNEYFGTDQVHGCFEFIDLCDFLAAMIMCQFIISHFGERIAAHICNKIQLETRFGHISAIYHQRRFLFVFVWLFPRAILKYMDPKDFEDQSVRSFFEFCDICDMLLLPETMTSG